MTEAVVGQTLLGVLEDLVGFSDGLELGLGPGVARVEVRVVLLGKGAVGALEFLVARQPSHPEDFVIIAFIHVMSGAVPLGSSFGVVEKKRTRGARVLRSFFKVITSVVLELWSWAIP